MEPAHAVHVAAAAARDELLPIRTLLRQTLAILVPTDLSSMLWMSSQMVTLYYVSNTLGELAVAQYTTGIVIFNMAGFSFIQGFGAAIDTLSSQAYGRDRRSPEVGEVVQFALALDVVLGVCIAFLFYHSLPVMVFVFGPEVGPGVTVFLRWSSPYLLVQIISGVLSKTMYAQKQSQLVAIANGAAALTSPLANYFLTHRGVHGAVLSLFCSTACCAATHIACVLYHPAVIVRLAPWPTPRLRSRDAWRRFFRVGTPALIATCAEWWAFEFQTVLAARISPRAVAINGVAMTLVNVMFSAALGVCVSASVMVGNALGGARPRGARQYAYFILCCDVALLVLTAAVVMLLREPIAHVLSSEASLVDGVRHILPFVVLCHMGDSLQFCLQGIFRGAGRQRDAGMAVLASLWCVGVPASALLVLGLRVGVAGCLGGLLVGFVVEIPLLYYWMTCFDWPALARKAHRGAVDAAAMDVVVVDVSTSTTTTGTTGSTTATTMGATMMTGLVAGQQEEAVATQTACATAAITTAMTQARVLLPPPSPTASPLQPSSSSSPSTMMLSLHGAPHDDEDDPSNHKSSNNNNNSSNSNNDDNDSDDRDVHRGDKSHHRNDTTRTRATMNNDDGAAAADGVKSSSDDVAAVVHPPCTTTTTVTPARNDSVAREQTESPLSPQTHELLPPLLSPTALQPPRPLAEDNDGGEATTTGVR